MSLSACPFTLQATAPRYTLPAIRQNSATPRPILTFDLYSPVMAHAGAMSHARLARFAESVVE